MILLKRLATTILLMSALFCPTMAQQKADTTYTFRFMAEEDMFYVPWNGNDTELARLLECIESNKATILDGKLPLYVDGQGLITSQSRLRSTALLIGEPLAYTSSCARLPRPPLRRGGGSAKH